MKTAFDNAMAQLDHAAKKMGLDQKTHERLRHAEKEHTIAIPVTMDDGSQRVFTGYRVQYNSARGPYKGGIRFSDLVDIHEVKALSFWMAIKTAAVGLPLGGGKGGVIVNPRELSEVELEKLSRGWVRGMYDNIGPDKDVPAPDVATTPQIMGWMADEYSQISGAPSPGSFTGKDVADGGIVARGTSTARGAFYLLGEMQNSFEGEVEQTRIGIQGFGNAGSVFAALAYDAGYKIVSVSDSRHSLIAPDGLNPHDALVYKSQHRTFEGYVAEGVEVVASSTASLEVECDVLMPATIENQITTDNVDAIKARYVIELANGPVTPEADAVLTERGVMIVPDVLANAGGVIVSYYEWCQNTTGEVWSEQDTNEKLRMQITDAYDAIKSVATEHDATLRTAAFIKAIEDIKTEM